jgi:thiosulfate/3-mercaptopyruvate sulfurtransferase
MSERVTTSVAELDALLRSDRPPLLLDVRWALGDPHGRAHYVDGHIPGAVYADLDTELAAPASPEGGRHPLTDLGELEATARGWGLAEGQQVVVYDDLGNTAAARAWWLLRHAGVADVTLLDGALGAWRAAGLPLESGLPEDPAPGDVALKTVGLPVTDADGAAELAAHGLLLDARAGERYRGEVEPVDPRAGHIPGAVSAPTGENLAADGTFLPPEVLRERFVKLGAASASPEGSPSASPETKAAAAAAAAGDRIGVYCGSGVTAAHQIAALYLAGFEATLFAGSWSAWSADPARPAATGPLPS